MDTDSVTDTESLPRVLGNTEEGELSDIEQDLSRTDAAQALSEEDVDSALSSFEDNPFAAPQTNRPAISV